MPRLLFRVSVTMVCLFVFSGPALAHDWVNGHSSTVKTVLNSAADWIPIRKATVTILPIDSGSHGCVATASADVRNPGGVGGHYRFVLSRNNANPSTNGGSERLLELVDNPGVSDPFSMPVSTTHHYLGLTNDNGANGGGAHTFYLLGRKVDAADANATVLDASLSVICVDTPL